MGHWPNARAQFLKEFTRLVCPFGWYLRMSVKKNSVACMVFNLMPARVSWGGCQASHRALIKARAHHLVMVRKLASVFNLGLRASVWSNSMPRTRLWHLPSCVLWVWLEGWRSPWVEVLMRIFWGDAWLARPIIDVGASLAVSDKVRRSLTCASAWP